MISDFLPITTSRIYWMPGIENITIFIQKLNNKLYDNCNNSNIVHGTSFPTALSFEYLYSCLMQLYIFVI